MADVTLTHPRLRGRTITVPEDQARVHEKAGWVPEKSVPAKKAGAVKKAAAKSAPADDTPNTSPDQGNDKES